MQINPVLLFRVEKDFGCGEAWSVYTTPVFRNFFIYLTNAFWVRAIKIYKLFSYNSPFEKIFNNEIYLITDKSNYIACFSPSTLQVNKYLWFCYMTEVSRESFISKFYLIS